MVSKEQYQQIQDNERALSRSPSPPTPPSANATLQLEYEHPRPITGRTGNLSVHEGESRPVPTMSAHGHHQPAEPIYVTFSVPATIPRVLRVIARLHAFVSAARPASMSRPRKANSPSSTTPSMRARHLEVEGDV